MLAAASLIAFFPTVQAGTAGDFCYGTANAFFPPLTQLYPTCNTINNNEPTGAEGLVIGIVLGAEAYEQGVYQCIGDTPINQVLTVYHCL